MGSDAIDETAETGKLIGRGGIQATSAAREVLAFGPIRPDYGKNLWYYANGVWLPDGEAEVTRRLISLLPEQWRPAHVDVVAKTLSHQPPFIGGPPEDRLINCRNGLIDWQTGELRHHTPNAPSTVQVAASWNVSATCPTVDEWIEQVFPSDAHDLVWEIIGYFLLPTNPLHRAVLCLGPGRNGKGTFLRLMEALLGESNCANVPLQELAENRFAAARLVGKAANISGDIDARSLGRTDIFKMLTGGDRLTADKKYGHMFEFRFHGKNLFAANELPGTSDHSDGFHSRFLILPFIARFDALDRTLSSRMAAEMDGVLLKAVAGLRRLMERGDFAPPGSVLAVQSDYRSQSDPVRQWASEEISLAPDHSVDRRTVYRAYDDFCNVNGYRPLGAAKFYRRLAEIYPSVGQRRSGSLRLLTGLDLSTSDVTPARF